MLGLGAQGVGGPVPQTRGQRLAEGGRAPEAVGGLAGQGPGGDRGQSRRRRVRQGAGLGAGHQHQHGAHVLARMGRPPAEHVVEQAAEQEDVGARVQALGPAVQGLGGHVARRAGHRQRALGHGDGVERQAPVHQIDLAVGPEHHVLGLEVEVEDALGVGEAHRVHDLGEHAEVGVEPAPLGIGVQLRSPGAALDALHDQERRAPGVGAEGVDGHDVRVLEAADDPRLLEQSAAGLVARLRVGALHGDRALERVLDGGEHGAEATAAELALQAQEGVDAGQDAGLALRRAVRCGAAPPRGPGVADRLPRRGDPRVEQAELEAGLGVVAARSAGRELGRGVAHPTTIAPPPTGRRGPRGRLRACWPR